MKSINIRQMRGALSGIEEILAKEGELLITRRDRPVARLLPVRTTKSPASHADLRASMRYLKTGSEALVRAERDSR